MEAAAFGKWTPDFGGVPGENSSECGGCLLQSNRHFASHLAMLSAAFAEKMTICHSFRMPPATTRDKVCSGHYEIIAKFEFRYIQLSEF